MCSYYINTGWKVCIYKIARNILRFTLLFAVFSLKKNILSCVYYMFTKETRKVGCLILKQSSKYIINIAVHGHGHKRILYFSFLYLLICQSGNMSASIKECWDTVTSRENGE